MQKFKRSINNAGYNMKRLYWFLLSPLSLAVSSNVQAAPNVNIYGGDQGPVYTTGGPYYAPPSTTITITDGGKLNWSRGLTYSRDRTTHRDMKITVTGKGSSFTIPSYLILGNDYAVGSTTGLDIRDGGFLTTDGINLGYVPADLITVNVAGADSLIRSDTMLVGRGGADTTVNLSDGGTIKTDTISIGEATAAKASKFNISGGNLITKTITVGNSKTNLINDGTLQADSIEFNSNKGLISVGDGSSNAKFDVKVVKFTAPGTVEFNYKDDAEVSSNFSGNGKIVKTGSSFLNLTGDNSNFSGLLDLQEGQLDVHGVFGTKDSKVDVASGAVFGGDGVISGTVDVASGGHFNFSGDISGSLKSDPTSDIALSNVELSELSVSNEVVVGGTYKVRVDPLSNNSDLLHSFSSVSLAPSSILEVKKFRPGDYTPGSRYKVIQADSGLTGQFARISGDIGSRYLYLRPFYDTNSLLLIVDKLNSGFADDAVTSNQSQVANSLYNNGNQQSKLWQNFAALNDAAKARNVLDQLSGDFYSSMWSAAIDESDIYRRTVNLRLIRASSNEATDKTFVDQNATISRLSNWTSWIAPYGSHASLDGSEEAGTLSRSSNGVIFGVDGAINDTWRVGFAGAAGSSRFASSSRNASAKGEQYQFGTFASAKWDKLNFRGGLSQSISDLRAKRSVSFDGFSDTSKGSVDIITRQVFGEVSYDLKYRSLDVSPFLSAAYVDSNIDGFKEKGGDTRLNAEGVRKGVTFATVGSRLGKSFKIGDWNARMDGSLGYRQTLGSEYAKSKFSFADGQGDFKSEGVPLERNLAVTDLSFNVSPLNNVTTGLSYQGKYGGGSYENSVVATVQMKF